MNTASWDQIMESFGFVFVFQYAILLTIVATIVMKYTLHVIDLQSENPWDNKAVYLLYTELIMGMYLVCEHIVHSEHFNVDYKIGKEWNDKKKNKHTVPNRPV